MKNNKLMVCISAIVIILVIALSFGLGSKDGVSKNEKDLYTRAKVESGLVKNDEKKDFTKIDVSKYLEYYSGSKDTLVLVGRLGCQYCQIAEPIIQNIMYKNNLDINYLSTDDFDIETEEQFMSSNEELDEFSTPLLMVVSNNTIKDSLEGLYDTETYTNFFKDDNFIGG